VTGDGLALGVYFGERDRVDGAIVADALATVYAELALPASVLMRGMEGFGAHHRLRTDQLLTLSEDLPMLSTAVGLSPPVQDAAVRVLDLPFSGLVTLERLRIGAAADVGPDLAGAPEEELKLTVYLGRHERTRGRPASEALVDLLHGEGVAGATVLLGVDGTLGGVRRRSRFFGRNADVPLTVVTVGAGAALASAFATFGRLRPDAPVTIERVRVLRRDGSALADLPAVPGTDASGLPLWQKLTVFCREDARDARGDVLHAALVRRLREAGAAGATTVRGVFGYHGDHLPHGDEFWHLRRRVPIALTVVERPERMAELWPLVAAATARTGLVTSEIVPASRAGEQRELRLARP
jgi:PII-like signaling protein